MTDQLNKEFISHIHKHAPAGANIPSLVADILDMGKESVYRRLRGEIHFTFNEIASIALKMGFSIDNIVGIKNTNQTLFGFPLLLKDKDPIDIYIHKIEQDIALFKKINECQSSKSYFAINRIPHVFSLSYRLLSKFRFYKYVYQVGTIPPTLTLSEFLFPKELLSLQKKVAYEMKHTKQMTLILDDNVFQSTVKEINYFYRRNLISDSDIEELRGELLDIVNSVESWATNGVNELGVEVAMFISYTDIGTTYTYLECEDIKISYVDIYSITALDSQNQYICHLQKKWMESLKKFSILISLSGEVQRFEYFNKQREVISFLGKPL